MIFVALTATTVDEEEPQLLDQKIATEKVTTIECPAKPTHRRSHEATQPRLLTRAELDGRTTAAKAGTFPHLPSSAMFGCAVASRRVQYRSAGAKLF
jgi:hypothetical protein